MKRIKSKSFETRTEFFDAIDAIAAHETEIQSLTAKRNAKIQEVQAEYQPYIEAHEAGIKGKIALAEKYAETHRDELFPAKSKSAYTALASFGFRTNPPALKPLDKKWSWEKILKKLQELRLRKLIRTNDEVDKDAIKAAKMSDELLAQLGMKIVQPEEFYIEPKVDGAEKIKGETAS